MAHITVDKLQAGMVLDSEVRDRTGRILLKSGCELLEWHIEKLTSAGVEEVDIAGVEHSLPSLPVNIDPEILQQSIKVLDPAFTLVDLNWDVMKELHRLAVLREVRRITEGESSSC